MPNPTKLILQAIAETQAARKQILDLAQAVTQLGTSVGKVSDTKFDVETAAAVQKLDQLETALRDVAKTAEESGARQSKAARKAAVDADETISLQISAVTRLARDTEFAYKTKQKAQDQAAAAAEKAAQKEINAAHRQALEINRSIDQEARARNRAQTAADRKAAQAERAAEREAKAAEKAATAQERAAEREKRAAERAAAALERKAERDRLAAAKSDSLKDAVNGATRAMQLFFGSIVVQKLTSFIQEITRTGAAFEGYKLTLDAALGSTELAQEEIDRLRKVANTFGVDFEVLLQRFGRFKIAADSIGFSAEKTRIIFDGFVAVSRALGNTNEQTERTFVALEQIMSKGVVQSEELKQQLGDSLVGAYNNLGKAIGKTGVEFEKMLKENQILAKEAIPQLLDEFLKLTGSAVEKNVSSLNAELARTKNAIFDAKVVIAKEAEPALKDLLQSLRTVGKDGVVSFENLGKAVSAIVTRVKDLVILLDDLSSGNFADFGKNLAASIVKNAAIAARAIAYLTEKTVYLFTLWATRSTESAEKMAAAFRKGADEGQKSLEDLAKKIEETTDRAKRAAKDQADAQKEALNQVEELRQKVQQAADEAREAQKKKEQELTEAQKKELHKREEAFESFFARIADLAKKNPIQVDAPDVPTGKVGGLTGDFVSDDQIKKITVADEKVRGLIERINELEQQKQQLEESPYTTQEQLVDIEKTQLKIGELEKQLRRTIEVSENNALAKTLEDQAKAADKAEKAMQAYTEKVKAALVDLVRDNDAFRDSFLRLDQDGQAAITGLISTFEGLVNTGTSTEEDFRGFLAEMARIFGEAGVIGRDFATQLGTAFGQSDQSATALLGTLDELGDSTTKAAEQAKAGAETTAAAMEDQAARVTEAGKVTADAFIAQNQQVKQSVQDSAAATVEVLGQVSETNQQLQKQVASGNAVMLNATKEAIEGVAQAAIVTINETTTEILDGATASTEAIGNIADAVVEGTKKSVPEITNTTDQATGQVKKFGDVLVTVGADGKKTFTSVSDSAREAGSEIGNTVSVITNAEGKIVGFASNVEQAGDAAVKAFRESKKEVAETATAAQKVEKGLEGAKSSAETMQRATESSGKAMESAAKSAEALPASVDAATESQRALNAELQITKGLAVEITAEFAKWAGQI